MSNAVSSPLPTGNAHKPLLWLVSLAIFMQMLDSTIVNTALPAMARSLGESPLQMQSVVFSYALAVATFIPASGWIADRFGTRRTFMTAIILFTLGSLACALSPSLQWLVAARVLQGIGGAMLLPVGRLAVMRTVPREQFLSAMSFIAIPALIGPLLGPTLGGWMVEVASWHWIFLINLPIGLIGLVAALRIMPDHYGQQKHRFDLAGYLMLAFGMVALSLALDGVSGLGSAHALVILLAVIGIAALAGYWLHAANSRDALFPLTLFHVTSFRIGILGNLFSRIGSGAMPLLIPLLLQVGLGMSPMRAGMMMIPVALAGMAAKRAAVSLVQRFGYRRILMINTVCVGVAMAGFALIDGGQPVWVQLVLLTAFGAVNSMQFTVMNTVTLRDLDMEQASSGNSLLSMVMMLATGFGAATAGSLLATFGTHLVGHGATAALHATFICVGAITLSSTLVFWQLPENRPHPKAVEEVAE
ncbi:MFS transporter [Stenotrophomonas sp. ATCM1_4]|uniref:Multidrug transporter subunit MdtD n=1 Tax=Stenotrophomonas capsici TaxID=3110230 RepID=A0ABU5V9Q3_9GAMM|nr:MULTISPECIES: multidrug transporter subunit MdtD [unclassified Stenotrophomonas]MEA5668790.1 multidrug transporter subunit MdtD [Stenotrophomonas sp. MH1]TDB28801.1 MFS transporter [Stenotrophomonas sp. ATCM1_4]